MKPHATALAVSLALLVSLIYAAEPIKERVVSFEVAPKFRIEGAHTEQPYASFEIEGRHLIWPQSGPKADSLHDGRKYRFDITETREVIPLPDGSREIWSPELTKVSIGDTVIFDASLCKVHKQTMKRSEVPVVYGMPGGSTAYWTAFREEFPNCGILHGGCIVMPDRATGMCWKCDKCVAKKAKWKEPTK